MRWKLKLFFWLIPILIIIILIFSFILFHSSETVNPENLTNYSSNNTAPISNNNNSNQINNSSNNNSGNKIGGGSGGSGGSGPSGSGDNNKDIKICTPNCEGKQCGDDGCDNICGTCNESYSCDINFKCLVNLSEKSLFVSIAGNDNNNGTIDQPFATIQKARDAIRANGSKGFTVYIRGGTYFLNQSLALGSSDSGDQKNPNIYRNYPGENVVISGGKLLDPVNYSWQPVILNGNNIYKTNVGNLKFNSLFVEGERAIRAKEPDEDPNTPYADYFISKNGPNIANSIGFKSGDINANWTNLNQTEIHFLREFTAPIMRISSVNGTNNIAWFPGATGDSNTYFYGGNRYWVENVFEGLDTPGEWYLNKSSGDLYYYPLNGKNPDTSEIIAGHLGYDGTWLGASLMDVRSKYLEFYGLTFSHTDWYISDGGFQGYEMSIEESDGGPNYLGTGTAIYLRYGSEFINFMNCNFSHFGGNGFHIFGDGHTVSKCSLLDVGGNAIQVSDAYTSTSGYGLTYNISITDNIISNYGVIYPGKGINVGLAHDVNASYNSVSNGADVGIQFGAVERSGILCNNNTAAYNDIYGACSLMQDCSGLYASEAQPGTIFSHNKIHDIPKVQSPIYTDASSGKGLYLDEYCYGITVEDNWVYRVPAGMQFHITNGTIVRNNVFYGIKDYYLVLFGGSHDQFTNNIIYNTAGSLYYGMYISPAGITDYNLLYNANSSYGTWNQSIANIRSQGYENHSLINIDPLFVDAAHDNYNLQPNSPALIPQNSGGIGFQQIEGMDTVGPRSVIIDTSNIGAYKYQGNDGTTGFFVWLGNVIKKII